VTANFASTQQDTPPVANAGAPQTVTAPTVSGIATVTLDGSASTDDHGIVNYTWKEGTSQLANVATTTAAVSLAAGSTHTITLVVTDTTGQTASATTTVTVSSLPTLTAHAALDYYWVYQNTESTTQDRMLSVLTVTIDTPANSADTYAVTITEDGATPTHFTPVATANPLVWNLLGARKTVNPLISGSTYLPAPVTVQVTGSPSGATATAQLPLLPDGVSRGLYLIKLGDVNQDTTIAPVDKTMVGTKVVHGAVNGTTALGFPYVNRMFDMNGDGVIAPVDKTITGTLVVHGVVN
jgi:hypothetical protein